jgi:thiol-disulfide isomerase/thioredoxin
MKKTLLVAGALVAGFTTTSLAQTASKNVMIEEFTGAWCGWCVDGAEIVEELIEEHPDRIFSVGIHNGDDMVISENSFLENFSGLGGFPAGMVNRLIISEGGDNTRTPYRRKLGGDTYGWAHHSAEEMNKMVPLEVKLKAIKTTGSEVKISVDVVFNEDMAGDFRIMVYVSENEVTSSNPQANYLSNRAGYESSKYFSLPGSLPNYKHMWVLRAVPSTVYGSKDVIPNPGIKGNTYSKEYTYTIKAGEDYTKMHVAAFVIDKDNDEEIVNVNQAGMTPTGVEETTQNATISSVAPNPVSTLGLVKFALENESYTKVELLNIHGQVVSVLKEGLFAAGNHHAAIDATQLADGIYLVAITSDAQRTVQRIVVAK